MDPLIARKEQEVVGLGFRVLGGSEVLGLGV